MSGTGYNRGAAAPPAPKAGPFFQLDEKFVTSTLSYGPVTWMDERSACVSTDSLLTERVKLKELS
jgi:hypothetical protein